MTDPAKLTKEQIDSVNALLATLDAPAAQATYGEEVKQSIMNAGEDITVEVFVTIDRLAAKNEALRKRLDVLRRFAEVWLATGSDHEQLMMAHDFFTAVLHPPNLANGV